MGGNITISSITTQGSVQSTKRLNENEIKDVVRYFDEEIQFLTDEVNRTKIELTKSLNHVKSDLDARNNKMDENIIEMQQKIQIASISDVWPDLFGISSIIIGLIYSTIPELIFKIVN